MTAVCAAIFSLPTEILLEITAYYHHTTSLPYERHSRASPDKMLFGRFQVLRALSQTCRRFRKVFAFLAWERMELLDNDANCISMNRVMRGVLKSPSLPRSVRTLIVSLKLPDTNNRNLFSLLVRFLTATSQLTSLHIIDITDSEAGSFAAHLETLSFASVSTLMIPCSIARTLSCFPNINSLICADTSASAYDHMSLLKSSHIHCSSLESLVNFAPSPRVVHCVLKHFPLIKSLRFREVLTSDVLKLLVDLHSLRSLRFPYRYQHQGESLEQMCASARAIFAYPQQQIKVRYLTPEADIGDLVVEVEAVPA
ncbi:hypothetical protein C8R46DRAFT_1099692 [Mycena filopes]|nr:hypothetical protein C8R46DRAFT_1099692 [Mycena filopes]